MATSSITANFAICDEKEARAFNCCYNRPFSDVNAEWFIALMTRETFDYTEWRRENLFVGETVDSLMGKAKAMYSDV